MIAETDAARSLVTAMTFDGIIFDCDGTLVDSEVPGLDVLHELACAEGVHFTWEEAHQRFRGVRMAQCVSWIGAQLPDRPAGFELDFTTQVRAATAARFRQGLESLPGAHELLSQLTIPFCIATNGPREKVELSLELTGLRALLDDRVFCAYEVGTFKPDPGLFLHAAKALGVEPSRCAVVEDSLPGIQAGLAAGMWVFSLHPETGVPGDQIERITFISRLADLRQYFGTSGRIESVKGGEPVPGE